MLSRGTGSVGCASRNSARARNTAVTAARAPRSVMLVVSGIGHHSLPVAGKRHTCYGLLSSGRVRSPESPGDRLASALEVERGGTRVSEGDAGNWAAVARAVDDRGRELALRSPVPVAVVRVFQRPTSFSFSGISLSMAAITSGIWPFSHEVIVQLQCISSAVDSGSARRSADAVQPRCKSLIRRFTGRCVCR
jgi:hypothetical protein